MPSWRKEKEPSASRVHRASLCPDALLATVEPYCVRCAHLSKGASGVRFLVLVRVDTEHKFDAKCRGHCRCFNARRRPRSPPQNTARDCGPINRLSPAAFRVQTSKLDHSTTLGDVRRRRTEVDERCLGGLEPRAGNNYSTWPGFNERPRRDWIRLVVGEQHARPGHSHEPCALARTID